MQSFEDSNDDFLVVIEKMIKVAVVVSVEMVGVVQSKWRLDHL